MDTTQTPIKPDLNTLIRLYFDPNLEIPEVADRLGISVLDLSDYLLEPHVRAAVRRVRAMYRARTPHLAAASLHRNLKLLDSIAVLPDNPTPADRDRLRRTLDSSRRAADLLLKSTRQTPSRSSRATPSRATTLRTSAGTAPSLKAPSAPSVPSVPSSSPATTLRASATTPPPLKAPSVPSVPFFSSSSSPRPTNDLTDAEVYEEISSSAQEIRELVHELTTANPALAAEIAASLQSSLAAA